MEATLRERWLIRKDLDDVLRIEAACFDYPWDESDFREALTRRLTFAKVIEHNGRIVGYVVYDLRKRSIDIINFAIDPAHQRHGFGAKLLGCLTSKLDDEIRSIRCHIWERNLKGQLFMRAMGFRCAAIKRDFFEGDSAYVFTFRRGK